VLGKLNLHKGRWTATVGVVVAGGSMAYLILDDRANVVSALIQGLIAGVVMMAFLGVLAKFWSNREIESAKAEAGPEGGSIGMTFEGQIADAVGLVNERMNDQVAIIDKRLYDLEQGRVQRTEPETDG